MTIVVLGGTGKTGRHLVDTLRGRGEDVRVATRSSGTRFDWFDQSTWAATVAGASALYLVWPDAPEHAEVFVKQATEAGVRRFVALSAREIDEFPGYFLGMAAAERAVRDSGAEWTIIRANNFNQNFDDPQIWLAPLREGRLALPIGDTPEPFIDTQDIADVAAAALTQDGHHEQVYTLSGPRALTFGAAVAAIAKASGRSIRYEELTPEQYRDELLAQGVSEEAAAELDALFAGMRAGLYTEPHDDVRRVLGRAPIAFDAYVARTVSAWR
ncbi:NmrA family NAD(P)-binding protein [Nonomuraea aurantiaca]|uniref:NmrA family NAD(P)-binding protein n=1 Tax=Nonomuraea aurantiaca TaxID=2878562 RepID=UPI001CD9681E|nr:NAD(P)H-binding protein [Nonomuraea aurantiaca]MCA2229607.1 NAD(P)H-binding protein [Nonomuraea aurantiaca]